MIANQPDLSTTVSRIWKDTDVFLRDLGGVLLSHLGAENTLCIHELEVLA